MNDDAELLRRYADEGAEDAFSELVQRHVNFVYSAALRQLNGDAHLAADATQLVFTDLARKAQALANHRVLAGWLFTSTRFATAKLVRGERRRHAREQEAQLMHELNHGDSGAPLDWQRVRPVLDEALGELPDGDREAILLRFFEGCNYAAVGARLKLADNAARMRVERALDKLRALLERRGVTSTSAALAAALASHGVAAAPLGLAAVVTGAALAGGAASAGATVAAASAGGAGAATFMSMTKLQLGLTGALAVAGATGFVVQADTNAGLRAEADRIRHETTVITTLQTENERLARTAAEVVEMRRDDAEFTRLSDEANGLRTRLQQLARAEEARAAAAKANAEIFAISQLDRTPVAKFMARPSYPAELRAAGTPGEVIVDFLVDANGDVQKAYALRSTQREFEQAAVDAVSKWKFKAGQKGGQDVVTRMQVPIVFALKNVEQVNTAAPKPAEAGAKSEAASVKLSPFVVETAKP